MRITKHVGPHDEPKDGGVGLPVDVIRTDCRIHLPHAGIDALVYDSLISMGRISRPFSDPGLALQVREALTCAYAVGVLC